jgi:hypothetical protein
MGDLPTPDEAVGGFVATLGYSRAGFIASLHRLSRRRRDSFFCLLVRPCRHRK